MFHGLFEPERLFLDICLHKLYNLYSSYKGVENVQYYCQKQRGARQIPRFA